MSLENRLRDLERRIEELGPGRLDRVEFLLSELKGLVREYEDKDRTFKTHRSLRMTLDRLARRIQKSYENEEIGEEVEHFDKALVHARDWHWKDTRRALEPLEEIAGLRDERNRVEKEIRRQKKARRKKRRELEERARRLRSLRDTRLDPGAEEYIHSIQERLDRVNERIVGVLDALVSNAPTREVIRLLGDVGIRPELGLPRAPDKSGLMGFLGSHPVGNEPIYRVLEYADYSDSRLSHYVDRPREFKDAMSANLAYLEKITDIRRLAPKLQVEPGGMLARRLSALTSLVSRAGSLVEKDTSGLVQELREMRREVLSGEYARHFSSYRRIQRLSQEERRLVEAGAVEDELAEVERRLEDYE